MYACGDHTLCAENENDWCLAAQLALQGKTYYHKCVFDLENKNLLLFERYKSYHIPMVTNKKLQEMRHQYHTNINKRLNMRNTEVAPKNRNFSKILSLCYWIQHVICVYNVGYKLSYGGVMKMLMLTCTSILHR